MTRFTTGFDSLGPKIFGKSRNIKLFYVCSSKQSAHLEVASSTQKKTLNSPKISALILHVSVMVLPWVSKTQNNNIVILFYAAKTNPKGSKLQHHHALAHPSSYCYYVCKAF